MKAKCYACDEKIDIHNKCRKRACRAQLEKRIKTVLDKCTSENWDEWNMIDRTSRPRIPWISAD